MDKEVKEKKVCRQQVVFCVLVVLYVFVSLLFSLPVHAADQWTLSSNSGSYDVVVKYYNPDKKLYSTDTYTTNSEFFGNSNYFYGAVVEKIDSYFGLNVFYYDLTTHEFHNPAFSDSVTLTQILTDDNGNIKQTGSLQYSSLYIRTFLSIDSYETDLPCFGSLDSFKNYCLTGDSSGLLNSGSIDNPDFQDTAYAFTGFTANNKMTATWTGTTERSYLKDEDVEEYVRVSYGFAAKDAPDSIKQVDNDSKEYSTAAKSLTVNVSDLVPDDDNWFLRYVQVVPCYRQAGLGAWGDFYHGVPCKVYFNEDGSIDKIVRDFPQSSGDYSYKHIFSLDKYSKTIPAPELSSISHNGFTLLNNTNNDYFVDIIVESKFYGVKMEKSAGTWLPTVDTDWIYSSHYYNFADTSQIAINNDVIYFPNLFSANPENDLITDFKNWSSEYPNYSDLPTMSFLKHSTAARTTYNLKFLFDEDSNYTDSEQLRYSSCAESVFYVRYYNKSMVYGPWVRYKYRDGASAKVGDTDYGGAFVDVGQVDTDDDGNVKVDDNGNPVVSDNVSGRQDYDTGETNYGDSSFSFDLSDISKFFDYLKKIFESVLGSLSAFGSVVAACFPFLPEELVNAVIFGICVMMFVGIIKVVK